MTRADLLEGPRRILSQGVLVLVNGFILGVLTFSLTSSPARGDDAEIARSLREKGATVDETKGFVTMVTINDCSILSATDFRQLGQLARLKRLSFGPGLDDESLALLSGSGLPELESLQTNLMVVTDDGLKPLVQLKTLRDVKFFHPSGKPFTGAGLAHLADLPNLERLTVAGSLAFGDEGMAAVSKLTQLKGFRTWHAGQTIEGLRKLKDLKNLKSLDLGQRLTYKPPPCLSDETIAILAELKSLESLQLDEARLTLGALGQLKQLPQLKTLTLGGIDIPEADVERLRTELPRVKITWTKPNEVYLKRIGLLFGDE